MTYTLQEQYTSKNQVAGSAADSVWHLGARKVSSITIHHWGLSGQQFDTVRDFLCTNDTPTSAHYVVEDGLVACIVSPDDCAFHAGNAEGNSHSIGIECRPEATDGDYATIAELITYLRSIYGDIPLYPHNHWYNTACPGDYDLARLDSLARGTIAPQSTTVQEDDMPLSDDDLNKIYNRVWFGGAGLPLIQNRRTGNGSWPETFLGSFEARVRDEILPAALANVPANVLNQPFTLPDGTKTNIAGILGAINAKPATVTNVSGAAASVDVDALVARLKAELPAAVLAELTAKLTKP